MAPTVDATGSGRQVRSLDKERERLRGRREALLEEEELSSPN